MADNERDTLKRYISIIRDFTEDRTISGVEVTFYDLATLDQQRNEDLWDALRQALRENADLQSELALLYLTDEEYAAKGCWWFDPETWAVKAASA